MTAFLRGTRVSTTHRGYLNRDQVIRYGEVVGYCRDPRYVRVRWDGWKGSSSTQVGKLYLTKEEEIMTPGTYTIDPCRHLWEEQPGEPPRDVCFHCGKVRE
jgi:hypothetical protein